MVAAHGVVQALELRVRLHDGARQRLLLILAVSVCTLVSSFVQRSLASLWCSAALCVIFTCSTVISLSIEAQRSVKCLTC